MSIQCIGKCDILNENCCCRDCKRLNNCDCRCSIHYRYDKEEIIGICLFAKVN